MKGRHPEYIKLIHDYLDDDLTTQEESELRKHLENCGDCQRHFHELTEMISLIKQQERFEAPRDFTQKVMKHLPEGEKHLKYQRWLRNHPIMAAAIVFLALFTWGAFSLWNNENELVVSKQDELIIEGDQVIVPSGVTVKGDLLVKNGKLRIDGTVNGDVTLIKSHLIESNFEAVDQKDTYAGEIHGELKYVNEIFEWIGYRIGNFFKNVFSF